MISVKSCGVLLFRQQPQLEFLLMCHQNRYDLPKGHIEGGETEKQCALRELLEETGIGEENIRIEPAFSYLHTYYPRYKRYGNKKVEKTIVIFLAYLDKPSTIKLGEHRNYQWTPWSPPHKIQSKTIDPLLEKVELFFSKK